MIHNGLPESISNGHLLPPSLVTAAIFDPLKRRIQGWVDKAFDRQSTTTARR